MPSLWIIWGYIKLHAPQRRTKNLTDIEQMLNTTSTTVPSIINLGHASPLLANVSLRILVCGIALKLLISFLGLPHWGKGQVCRIFQQGTGPGLSGHGDLEVVPCQPLAISFSFCLQTRISISKSTYFPKLPHDRRLLLCSSSLPCRDRHSSLLDNGEQEHAQVL